VTDANLFLGRIQPKHFPAIFGATQDQPLDLEATRSAFEKLTAEINANEGNAEGANKVKMTPEVRLHPFLPTPFQRGACARVA
jgi:N-methylhydantoinase A/oxoprolinase/acetone carboxylase beta subunit